MIRESKTLAFLKGRKYPGFSSPVADVKADGDVRIVRLRDGTVIKSRKQTLRSNLHRMLARQQTTNALRSLRENPDGTASVTIGGSKQGERKTYTNEAAAKAAVKRYHGKYL